MPNIKAKIIFLLAFICLSAPTVFGSEVELPLPSDKFPVIWRNSKHYNLIIREYVEGDYNDEAGNQYSVRMYDNEYNEHDNNEQRAKSEFFAIKLYELFGFSSLPQYLVNANKIKSSYGEAENVAVITKLLPDLKPLDKLSSEDLANIQEPLAKLHLVSALIGNNFTFPAEEKLNCGIFVKEGKIYVAHTPNAFGYGDNDNDYGEKAYNNNANEFKQLIQPQDNWHAAKILQEPFKIHTLKNPQKFIAWLESAWDENKIDALFKESGIENQEILINLKLRFKDLKKQLAEVNISNYELYTSEKILKIIAGRNKYNSHAYYEFKEVLPRVEEQIFICTNGNKVWLELTNYEFLINGKKSNRIVKIYVGDVGSNDMLNPTEKHSLQIFDPETVFVFMKAVLNDWDAMNHSQSSVSDLARVLQVGYQEVIYHFNLVDSTESTKAVDKIFSFGELVAFWQALHEKYAAKVRWIGRLVTVGDIEKRKAQGFDAYYPNPAYLGSIAAYKRPSHMSYEQYVATSDGLRERNMDDSNVCSKAYLAKKSDVKFDHCDEYNSVLEKIYPDDITYLNDTHKFHFSDFNRTKNIYGFRGDDRTVDEIYSAEGIWPRGYIYGKTYLAKTDRKKLLENKSFWEIPVLEDGTLHHGSGPYISTSKNIDVTEKFGKNVYVVLTDGGLILPQDNEGKKVDDTDLMEIAVPGGVDWKNVIGERDRRGFSEGKYSFGPIYLKQGLIKDDPKNFWEILQILGDRPQCDNGNKLTLKMAKSCTNFWDEASQSNADKIINKLVSQYQYHENYQEIQDYLMKCNKINVAGGFCQEVLHTNLNSGYSNPESR